MREIKGSYLLWGTIGIYLLYLFCNWMNIEVKFILELITVIIILIGIILILGITILLFYIQIIIPVEYIYNRNYFINGKSKYNWYSEISFDDLKFKNFYLNPVCIKKQAKFIRFSIIYWIVVIIEEINIFCNKYFTFKF
jgi:hypothetical protein